MTFMGLTPKERAMLPLPFPYPLPQVDTESKEK